MVEKAIKRARHMALVPYIVDTKISLILLMQDHFTKI